MIGPIGVGGDRIIGRQGVQPIAVDEHVLSEIGKLVREPRPMKAMRIIAIQVRAKLIIDAAAGS